MTNTTKQTDIRYAPSDGWVLDVVLRVKIPRSLCGVRLVGDPDKPEPGFDAPTCPRCVAHER